MENLTRRVRRSVSGILSSKGVDGRLRASSLYRNGSEFGYRFWMRDGRSGRILLGNGIRIVWD